MTKAIQRVLLDMDGVLVDFIGGACRQHNKIYPHHPHNPSTQLEQMPWDIEPVFDMSAKDLWAPLGREFWANLQPLPHFRAFLGTLEAHFGPDKICILTSSPAHSRSSRRQAGLDPGKHAGLPQAVPRGSSKGVLRR